MSLRPSAPCPSLRPNSRIAAASLAGVVYLQLAGHSAAPKPGHSMFHSLSRDKPRGGAASFLSGAGFIACKDVGHLAAFSCPWPPSLTFYKLREIERTA